MRCIRIGCDSFLAHGGILAFTDSSSFSFSDVGDVYRVVGYMGKLGARDWKSQGNRISYYNAVGISVDASLFF